MYQKMNDRFFFHQHMKLVKTCKIAYHIRTVQVIWCAAHTEHLQRIVQIKVFIARLHNI